VICHIPDEEASGALLGKDEGGNRQQSYRERKRQRPRGIRRESRGKERTDEVAEHGKLAWFLFDPTKSPQNTEKQKNSSKSSGRSSTEATIRARLPHQPVGSRRWIMDSLWSGQTWASYVRSTFSWTRTSINGLAADRSGSGLQARQELGKDELVL